MTNIRDLTIDVSSFSFTADLDDVFRSQATVTPRALQEALRRLLVMSACLGSLEGDIVEVLDDESLSQASRDRLVQMLSDVQVALAGG